MPGRGRSLSVALLSCRIALAVPAWAQPATMSTTSTTITTTTTTLSTTTTTTPVPPENICLVTFRLSDPIELGALQIAVDYGSLDGHFLRKNPPPDVNADCVATNAPDFASFNAGIDARVFRGAFIAARGFTGPIGLAHCRYAFELAPPQPTDFPVIVEDATTPRFEPVVPPPTVIVSSVQCPAGTATTTTLSTTTTITTTTTTTTVPPPGCGLPVSFEGMPMATDALSVLRTVVGLIPCPLCVCDTNGSGTITATDARRVLLVVVGNPIELTCPACGAARAIDRVQ